MKRLGPLLLSLVAAFAVASPMPPLKPSVVIGVTEFALSDERAEIMEALETALRPLDDAYDVQTRVYTVPQLEKAARAGEVDLVLGSAGLVRRLADVGLKTIVSSVGPGAVDANRNEGSTMLVKQSRHDLQTIRDLQGQRLIANRPTGFSGYLIALGEIAMAGHDPDTFFSQRLFVGEQSATVRIATAVAEGTADVGVLKLCAWERLIERHPEFRSSLRVLSAKDSPSACRHSTELYPAHTLAALPHVSPSIVTSVTLAFLQMPATKHARSWAVATDFLSVDTLYKSLKMGPYAYLRENVLKRFIQEYQRWIWMFLIVAFLMLLQFVHTRRLLEKRTRQVKTLMQRQAEQDKKLLFLERNTTVSQLSSMIAHELHQPLTSIRLYARGLAKLTASNDAAGEVADAVASIANEATRAKDIVERVRAYAKERRPALETVTLASLLTNAVSHFQAGLMVADGRPMKVEIAPFDDAAIKVAPLEMELVFVNLLKNARDAGAERVRVLVDRSAGNDGHALIVRFVDNGPEANAGTLERLSVSASSRKPEGLGLGLGIARRIVEQHAGHLRFALNAPDPGLTVTVILPLPRDEAEVKAPSDEEHVSLTSRKTT